jgi:predicted unusual protein kinase regulating ubiquinone biosynthesis (AarF/ABC1/UbiB family)
MEQRVFDGLHVGLRVVDAFLRSIEAAVWELRLKADELSEGTAKIARLSQTGARLAVVVTSYRLHATHAAFLPRRLAKRRLDALHVKNARRLREVAETHGGAFLKVGQLLSARPDILPKAFVDELAVLQDAAPRVPFAAIRPMIASHHFARFEEEPIAAASMGQVHRATTASGIDVAVKVQRPGIRPLVEQDLAVLGIFLDALAPMFPPTDHATIAKEIRASVLRELDFEEEAAAATEIGAFLRDVPGVLVPEVVETHSTAQVLTTRFIEGRKITDVLDELASAGHPEATARRDALLGTLLEIFVRQILEAGHFHSDPHPGNILVTHDDEIVLLDFGSSQKLARETRREYLALVFAFTLNDVDGTVRSLRALGFRTRSGNPETLLCFAEALIGSFATSAREARFPTKEELEQKARELFTLAAKDPVEAIPPEFVMIARVIGTLAGLFTHYTPSIDIPRRLLPAIARAMAV